MEVIILLASILTVVVGVVEAAAKNDVDCNVADHTFVVSATALNLSWSLTPDCNELSGLKFKVSLTHLRYRSCKERSQGGTPIQQKTEKTELVLDKLEPFSDYFVKIEGVGASANDG